MSDILIFRARQADVMRALIDRAGSPSVRAINVDTDVLLDNWLPQLEFVQYRDMLDRQALDQIGLDSLALAQSWYKVGGSDPTAVDGLSFGQYIDYEMKRVFTVVCRHIAFLDVLRPTRILLADDGSLLCHATMAFAASRGTPVVGVPANPVSQQADWLLPEFRPPSRFRGVFKWLLCEVSQILGNWVRSESLTLLVWPHIYTESLIETILTQTRHRIVWPSFTRAYLGHPRVILTDWQLAPGPGKVDPSRASTWHALEAEMARLNVLSYHGVALWPVVRHVARSYWDSAWEIFQRQVRYYSRLFRQLHLDAVVVVQDQADAQKAWVMLARQQGVHSYYILHGDHPVSYLGHPRFNTDTLITFGDEWRERSHQFVPLPRVLALGNDELGYLSRRVNACDRESLRRRIGLRNQAGTVILFAASPYDNSYPTDEPSDQNRILQAVCRVAAQLMESYIVIRLHPSTALYESVQVKHAIVKHYNRGNLLLDPGLKLEEALAVADVVVSVESNFGMQGVAARRPLVVFDPLNLDGFGYARGEAEAVAHTEGELLATLKHLVTDARFRDEVIARGQRFLTRRVVGLGDGQAGARLLAEIERACKTATRNRNMALT